MNLQSSRRGSQGGAVAILVGLFLIVLLTIGALAVDLGRAWGVKSELQNAADAGALAGAKAFNGYALIYQSASGAGGPDWAPASTAAWTAATNYTTANRANGQNLTATQTIVLVGYWNTVSSAFRPVTSTAYPPSPVPVAYDVPAVKVTVVPNTVATTFARAIGTTSIAASASAVAVVAGMAPPASDTTGTAIFPMAVNQCVFEVGSAYWNNTGQASEVTISDSNNGGTTTTLATACGNGNPVAQWSNLNSGNTGADTPKNIINKGLSVPLSICTPVSIDPGVSSSVYQAAGGLTLPLLITVPVVANSAITGGSGSGAVIAFMPFLLTNVVSHSTPQYIQGYFEPASQLPGVTPGTGVGSGASSEASCCFSLTTPPSLVQFQ